MWVDCCGTDEETYEELEEWVTRHLACKYGQAFVSVAKCLEDEFDCEGVLARLVRTAMAQHKSLPELNALFGEETMLSVTAELL